MNYENTVKSLLMMYSNIFPNHFAVADHLFATIGNGYEWVDGELVDCVGIEKNIPTEKDAIKKSFNSHFENYRKDSELLIKLMLEKDESYNVYEYPLKRFNSDVFLISKTNERFEEYKSNSKFVGMLGFGNLKVYPLSEYSAINTFPNDIKSDWKEALLKFVNYVLDNRILIDKDYNEDKQIKYLEKAKERLVKGS